MAHQRSEAISSLQREIRTLPVAFSGLLLGEDDRAKTSTPVVQQQAEPPLRLYNRTKFSVQLNSGVEF
ncbi:hypothetical protein AAC387_Pa03g1207 [Persea americana]